MVHMLLSVIDGVFEFITGVFVVLLAGLTL
jgi:hypothetical protein